MPQSNDRAGVRSDAQAAASSPTELTELQSPIGRAISDVGRSVDRLIDVVSAPMRPLRDRWRSMPLLTRWLPSMLTMTLVLWYAATFIIDVWHRHERFGTFDYDLGMYDHGIWQTAHGRNFMTTRGMDLFGHHANVGYLLFVPFYWIGIGGPHFLNIVNTLGVVAVALPVYWMATTHLRSRWAGFWLVGVYLFHFSPGWKIQETFHAESLAAPFVVGAFYFASVRRWGWYWFCIGAAMIWKEDIALATAMMGIVIAAMFGERRRGLATIGVSAIWFLIATKIIMASFAPDGAVFDSLFGPLGDDTDAVVINAVKDPTQLYDTIFCHGFWDGSLHEAPEGRTDVSCPFGDGLKEPSPRGLATLLQPTAYLGLASPILLLVGLPQQVINSATTAGFVWDLRWHYAFLPYIGVLLASTWTVVRRKRAVVAWAMIAAMVIATAMTGDRGIGPWSEQYRSGYWPLTEGPEVALYRSAIDDIDGDDVVSANYFFVPHLSHREYIYTFPNPWVLSNYGAGGTDAAAPDPNTVDVLVVDRARLNETDKKLFDELLDSGDFTVEFLEEFGPPGAPTNEVYRLRRIGTDEN